MRNYQGIRSYARVRAIALRVALTLALVVGCSAFGIAQSSTARITKGERTLSTWPTVQDGSFFSESLGREMKYRVILPAEYGSTTRRYPVLYLLHGYLGSYINWETRTDVVLYARNFPGIIVMPDAGNSWYVNSATLSKDRFEDYVIKDLVPHIEQKYRAAWRRSGRMIAGLSMGGYGALKFALKYPQVFGYAASISGAFNVPDELATQRPEFAENLRGVFGSEGNETRQANDVYALARKATPASAPYLYLDCGTSDYFLPANRRLVAELQTAGVRYEYHEVAGKHDWEYWNNQIRTVLGSATAFLQQSAEAERITANPKANRPARSR